MPGWLWAVIIAGVLVAVAFVVWQALKSRRTRTLQGRFGGEYDRTLEGAESRGEAEADLAARGERAEGALAGGVERRDAFDIKPLPAGARERYAVEWERVQARFVDDPQSAV